VFTLFELEGMTGDDIAETLEIPLGTVYSRLRIARDAFRRATARIHAKDQFRLKGHAGAEPRPLLKGTANADPPDTLRRAGGAR
jgi:RNA polymerase sigma-70 factor (ECF subfamily)